jgi:2'-5' RNA ligase
MLRLFFALQPTPAQCDALFARAAGWVTATQGQAAPAANFHATLCFLGAVAPERLDTLRATAAEVRAQAFALDFDRFEYWPEPRVLCATADNTANAGSLSRELHVRMLAAGFAPDAKPFRPHVTVARKLNASAAAPVEWPQALAPPIALRCDHFVLMESRRGESGSLYSVLDSWPLDAIEPLQLRPSGA